VKQHQVNKRSKTQVDSLTMSFCTVFVLYSLSLEEMIEEEPVIEESLDDLDDKELDDVCSLFKLLYKFRPCVHQVL